MGMLKSLRALKEEDHRRALYAVLVFIMLMILFFLLVGLKEPDPPLQEDIIAVELPDVEIEMGGAPEGGGVPGSEVIEQETDVVESAANIETQDESEVAVADGQSNSDEGSNQSNVDESLQFGNGGTNGGPGGGDEFGNGPGGGGNDTGPGGFGVYNPNRKVTKDPVFDSQVQEEGIIALDIWVDASGKVVKTRFKESESTSGSAYLIKLAEAAAMKMRYDAKNGAVVEHVGYKTFSFTRS
jgi:hypothetical protein